MRKFSASLAAAAVLLLASLALPAIASPLTYQITGGGGNSSVDLTANITYSPPGGGGFSLDAWVGPLSLAVTNLGDNTSEIQTLYCTDIFNDYQSGSVYQLGLLSDTISLVVAQQINALLSNVTPTDPIEGAALQAAIWKVENDPGNYDIQHGMFAVSPDGITGAGQEYQAFIGTANTYLHNVSSGAWRARAGTTVKQYTAAPGHSASQSFSFLSVVGVPEPASMAVFGTGLLALAGARRLRRRSAATPAMRRGV